MLYLVKEVLGRTGFQNLLLDSTTDAFLISSLLGIFLLFLLLEAGFERATIIQVKKAQEK